MTTSDDTSARPVPRDPACDECGVRFASRHGDWLAHDLGTGHARGCSLRLDNLVDPSVDERLAAAPAARDLPRPLRRAALRALALLAPDASRAQLANWLDHDQLPSSARGLREAGRVVALGFRAPTGAHVCAAAALLAGRLADATAQSDDRAHPAGHAFDLDHRGLRVLRGDDAILTLHADDLTQATVEDPPGHWATATGLPARCPDPLRVARWLHGACLPTADRPGPGG